MTDEEWREQEEEDDEMMFIEEIVKDGLKMTNYENFQNIERME